MSDFNTEIVRKSALVENQEITDEDLKKINKYALSPLTKEEVFVFKIQMGDNETDDRNYEPFNLQALKDLKKLYVGKTMIQDHARSAKNQVARVFDTELVTEPKMTKNGEPFTKLIGKCYMLKTSSNADLIAEIKGGIKKEVSTGTVPKKLVCSICGADNMKDYCRHYAGREYDKNTCLMTIDGCKEAYEVSFVAIPAQPRAGAIKHHGANVKPIEEPSKKEEANDIDVLAKVKTLGSFLFLAKQEDAEDE